VPFSLSGWSLAATRITTGEALSTGSKLPKRSGSPTHRCTPSSAARHGGDLIQTEVSPTVMTGLEAYRGHNAIISDIAMCALIGMFTALLLSHRPGTPSLPRPLVGEFHGPGYPFSARFGGSHR
jgi:hypothetical protein